MSDSSHDAAALMLLSMASSLPPKSQNSISTPVTHVVAKPVLEPEEVNIRPIQEPLIYVGVSLERPDGGGGSWGMTLFRMGGYLIVGGVQQDIMQGLTTWAWATETLPKKGAEFRSSFGPLYHTSLLQLVPGDVIISVNGKTEFDSSMWHAYASRLDILAVRLETARRRAHQVLLSVPKQENVQFLAAQAAFQTMEPLLTRTPIPKTCQRQLFPGPRTASLQSAARVVSEDSISSERRERKRSQDEDAHLPLEKGGVSEPQFHQWLEVRKNQWRSDRGKRRRLFESKPASVPRNIPQYESYQEPLEFLCFKLERESLETPWGIHVSHNDRHFLGVGNVNDGVEARTSWAWATTNTVSSALLNVRDEHSVRSIFESQPFHSSTLLKLQTGDFILSVSGRPISAFSSLTDIASVMTQAISLMLIVVRHRVPTEAAQMAIRVGKPATEITGTAYQSLMPVLYRSPITMATLFHLQHSITVPRKPAPPLVEYRNPLFQDDKGVPILYEDQGDYDESNGASKFLSSVSSETFPAWLKNRQATWREQRWSCGLPVVTVDDEWSDGDDSSISQDFWTHQGHPTFNDWLAASTSRWKQSYSWNRKKRESLAKVCEEVVHFPAHGSVRNESTLNQTRHWLRVRKQQWRLSRRKRQRRLEGQLMIQSSTTESTCTNDIDEDSKLAPSSEHSMGQSVGNAPVFSVASPRQTSVPRQTSGEMTIIDALLEEQEEHQRKVSADRHPLDISFLFDARLGAPDDVVAHCLEFLPRTEHGLLLCISATTSEALKEREEVWRQLCPSQWVLPRRPRKPWYEVYLTKIHDEVKVARKWADDFLNKAADILFHQDNFTKIERMVRQGEKRVDFDINYISGVVCERNSLLNLAAIYQRLKVVRWLVETKGADIETFDRGGFTPLLNAAWAGDKKLVRYLLSQGADRSKIGRYHYFTGINKPDFKGLNAEGWARKKGHDDLAELIRLGL